jgi:HlyD family secretion protein
MKKVGIGLAVLILIGAAIGGYQWWQSQAPQKQTHNVLRTAEVVRGDLELTVAASGNVAVSEKVDLYAQSQGNVTSVAVAVNERVEAGQELARVDTTDLERAVRQAKISLEQSELELAMLTQPTDEAELELARVALQSAAQALEAARLAKRTAEIDADQMVLQAQRARERAFQHVQTVQGTDREAQALEARDDAEEQERIAQLNAQVTREQAQDQWLAAYQRHQEAQRNVTRLEQGPDETQVRQAELRVEQARLQLRQAQDNLDDAILEAPIAGLVVAVNVQPGEPPPTTRPAITLVDDTTFYVDVAVDEIDIGKIAVGQSVVVTLDAYPEQPLEGVVDTIAPAPSASGTGGIIAYDLRVRLSTPPASEDTVEIRDGLTANVTINTDEITDTVLIPNWAVRTEQASGETYAYCYCVGADGTPQRVEITLGARNERFTQVLSGLEAGATVALVTEERELPNFGPPES